MEEKKCKMLGMWQCSINSIFELLFTWGICSFGYKTDAQNREGAWR